MTHPTLRDIRRASFIRNRAHQMTWCFKAALTCATHAVRRLLASKSTQQKPNTFRPMLCWIELSPLHTMQPRLACSIDRIYYEKVSQSNDDTFTTAWSPFPCSGNTERMSYFGILFDAGHILHKLVFKNEIYKF